MTSTSVRSIRFVPTEFAGYPELMGFHRQLLSDPVRTTSFVRAVGAVVRPGDIVVDIGTGSGVLALAACRAGASRVYAIEHASIVRVAQIVARHNHFADRIVFINDDSRAVQISEPVDVVISECLGLMGIGGTMVPVVLDMVRRALRPNGRVLPRTISAFLAPIESALNWKYVNAWTPAGPGDVDYSPLQELASNNAYISTLHPEDLIAPGQRLFAVDLRQTDWTGTSETEAVFRISAPHRFHGFCGWFEADLSEGVLLSTASGQPTTVWEQLFLPLEREVAVLPGDEIRVTFGIGPSRAGLPIAFRWDTEIVGPSGDVTASFRQTTDRSVPR